MKAVLRAAVVAGLGALAAIAWLALYYGAFPAIRLEMDVAAPRAIVSGLYPGEREPDSARSYAWTSGEVGIRIADLDRQSDWTLRLRVRGARANPAENPDLSFFVDGLLVQTLPTATDYQEIDVLVPKRPARSGVVLVIRPSATFVPGPSDPRPLGVMIDAIELEPTQVVLAPRAAFRGVALAAAALGATIALLGVTATSAVGAIVLVSAGLAALVAHGLGPYTSFPAVVWRVALISGVVTLLLAGVARSIRGTPFRNTATFAIVFSLAAFVMKLLALLHPATPIGDALFHAHRFQDVLAGTWYFTSVAPGGYQFPYAPGLYLTALPFAGLVTRGLADMTLLRIVVCIADAAAGLVLYGWLLRAWPDRVAAALAVALYHLMPLGFGVLAVGNLTNAFAQSLTVAALALMTLPSLRLVHRPLVVVLTVTLAAAFLSHTSTFAILSAGTFAVAALFWWKGGPVLRSPALGLLVALAIAIVFVVSVYYGRFGETYRTELARIGSETAAAAPDAGGRGVGSRLGSVPRYLSLYFGVVMLALAAWGASVCWRRGARDRATLTAAGWALTCGAFLVLGILTPVDMRYYLASIPVIALAAAGGAGDLWAAGGSRRGAAVLALAWICAVGVGGWLGALA